MLSASLWVWNYPVEPDGLTLGAQLKIMVPVASNSSGSFRASCYPLHPWVTADKPSLVGLTTGNQSS